MGNKMGVVGQSDRSMNAHVTRKKNAKKRANDPLVYRHNVIDKCWGVLERFLDDDSIPDKDKVFVSAQVALKEYDQKGKIQLQQLKGAQDVSKNLFLIEALNKAEKFNKTIDRTSLNNLAVNAGRKIDQATKDGVEVTEHDFAVISKDDTNIAVRALKQSKEIERKYKGNY